MQTDGRDGSSPCGSESVAQLVSAARAEELRLLDDAVRSLPSDAVKELLSVGVCAQCILRLFGIYGPCYSLSTDVLSLFPIPNLAHSDEANMKGELYRKTSDSQEELKESEVCRVCHGILQFIYVDDKGVLTRYNCAYTMALALGEHIKREGYRTESFSLEVSMPQTVVDNENQVRSYMKMKYSSENWFQENLKTHIVAVKDTLKSIITIPLEEKLGGKSGSSPFRVRLTYSSTGGPGDGKASSEKDHDGKKRKIGLDGNRGISCGLADGGTEQVDNMIDKAGLSMEKCHNSSHDSELFNSQVSPLCFTCSCHRTPVYVGGRYLKLSRNVSQTRWIIDDERMGEASVEEIIGDCVLPLCAGDSYKFHAAGREDIDVRMLGSGRPFLVEILNARVVPNEELVKEMELKINRPDQEMVRVRNLKVVDNQGCALMREGESEKQKQYAALVWTSRQLDEKDFVAITSFEDLKIIQRTPIRVLHRRSPLEREKIIHWMKIEKIAGKSQYFLLHLCTQAGTYIKEFVHGDLGRTTPSIGSILGCRAEILKLDVTDVKMDSFSD